MKGVKTKPSTRTSSRAPALRKTPTGIQGLDQLTGGGLPQGRPTLLCGGPGSGKTLLSLEFLARGAKEFGEPGVFVAFEEQGEELATNFASLGYDLRALVAQKQLAIDYVHVERSEIEETGDYDLGGLFIRLEQAIDSVGARRVVIDTASGAFEAATEIGVSSLMDTWLLLRDVECGTERNRVLHLLKSRGMAHSNQVREFLITSRGVELQDVYLGPSGAVLTGSARLVQKSKEEAQVLVQAQEVEARQRALDFKLQAVEAQIAALRAGYEIERLNAVTAIAQGGERARVVAADRVQMARQRQADTVRKGSLKQRRAGDAR